MCQVYGLSRITLNNDVLKSVPIKPEILLFKYKFATLIIEVMKTTLRTRTVETNNLLLGELSRKEKSIKLLKGKLLLNISFEGEVNISKNGIITTNEKSSDIPLAMFKKKRKTSCFFLIGRRFFQIFTMMKIKLNLLLLLIYLSKGRLIIEFSDADL
jgi:hypothetical protein